MKNEEIEDFSKRMLKLFDYHFLIKKESYKECDIKFIMYKRRDEEKEVRDLENKIFMFNDKRKINLLELKDELLDLSLMCMMLDYRLSEILKN